MAARYFSVETDVFRVERLRVSYYGNPRFRIRTTTGAFMTQTDSSVNYAVENHFHVDESIDVPAVLTLTPAGRVVGIQTERGKDGVQS